MQRYKNLSLHFKIFLISLLLCTGIAGLTASILINNNMTQIKSLSATFDDIFKHTSTITAGLLQHQPSAIDEGLKNLRLNLNISRAELFLYNGNSFLAYIPLVNQSKNNGRTPRMEKHADHTLFSYLENDFELIYPIVSHDEITGAIYITAKNGNQDIMSILEIIALVLILGIFIALYVEKIITRPLDSLVSIMRTVTQQNDFSIRVTKTYDDEIGVLADAFNSMMSTMQENEKQQRASQEQIKKLAYYDTVTGLPNRDFFMQLLKRERLLGHAGDEKTAILYIDLTNLNLINDTLGREAGDCLLQEVVGQLSPHDVTTASHHVVSIYRLSGDELIILLENIRTDDEIKDVASRVLNIITQSRHVCENEITLTASMGIAFHPTHAKDAAALIQNAAAAMYYAKQAGKNSYQIFHMEMSRVITKRMKIESALRKALARNEFFIYYQPKFHLQKNKIVGMEALIRWNHPEEGLIKPDEFISVIEEIGLIIDIGAWMLQQACLECKKLHAAGLEDLYVSVNVSGRQFDDASLITHVERALTNAGLAPSYLDIELTESIIMMNDEKTLNMLHALRKIGVKISIDDFGTGYSSLRYLMRYPINTIKIDKSFITYLLENTNNAIITKAIITLAHNLSLTVVAEGVETQAQLDYLRKNHCDEIQGYLIGKAVGLDDFQDIYAKVKAQYDE